MLALVIIALVTEFILNISIGVNAVVGSKDGNWVIVILAMLCLAAGVVGLVNGIKGIRDPLRRGVSIATTIIAGSAIVYGFAVIIIGVLMAQGISVSDMSFGSGEFVFTYLRMIR